MPCEWETISLGELFDFFGGLGIARDKLGDQGIPYLHYGDMHRHSFTKVSHEQYMLLPKYDTKIRGDENFLLHDGDVVFLDASEDLEGTSRSVVVDNVENKPFISGLHTFIARSKSTFLSKGYKQYFTSSQVVKRQFEKKAVGFKVYGVNRNSIKGIEIVYPTSKTEQNRIAEILLTQDKHIELQEKLITQKQEQKKYLMQVLLTGKQRLKGFKGEWESKKLGDICHIQDGYPLKSSSYSTSKKEIQVVRISDINSKNKNSDKVFIEQNQIVIDNLDSYLVNKGDLLLSLTGAAGFNFFIWESGKAILNQRTVKFIFEESNENMRHLLDGMLHRYLSEKGTGQNNNLSKDDLVKSKIKLPCPSEQEAIAEILTAADKEIELLQKQLEHEKQRKKSLMQLLLTGIVRV